MPWALKERVGFQPPLIGRLEAGVGIEQPQLRRKRKRIRQLGHGETDIVVRRAPM